MGHVHRDRAEVGSACRSMNVGAEEWACLTPTPEQRRAPQVRPGLRQPGLPGLLLGPEEPVG
jgi:hypothetical protein